MCSRHWPTFLLRVEGIFHTGVPFARVMPLRPPIIAVPEPPIHVSDDRQPIWPRWKGSASWATLCGCAWKAFQKQVLQRRWRHRNISDRLLRQAALLHVAALLVHVAAPHVAASLHVVLRRASRKRLWLIFTSLVHLVHLLADSSPWTRSVKVKPLHLVRWLFFALV